MGLPQFLRNKHAVEKRNYPPTGRGRWFYKVKFLSKEIYGGEIVIFHS